MMNKKWLIVPIMALLVTLYWVGSVQAQDNHSTLLDDGYPIDGGYPIEEPTQKPPQNSNPSRNESPTEVPATYFVVTTPEPFQITKAYCDGIKIHPALDGLSIKYGVPYDDVLGYSCEYREGVGEISLALQTVGRMDGEVTVEEILEMRKNEHLGWDEIWQRFGLDDSDLIDFQSNGFVWKAGRNNF